MSKRTSNHQWERVHGGKPLTDTSAAAERNKSTMKSGSFIKACETAGIPTTIRQASKWNNQKGAAYKVRKLA